MDGGSPAGGDGSPSTTPSVHGVDGMESPSPAPRVGSLEGYSCACCSDLLLAQPLQCCTTRLVRGRTGTRKAAGPF